VVIPPPEEREKHYFEKRRKPPSAALAAISAQLSRKFEENFGKADEPWSFESEELEARKVAYLTGDQAPFKEALAKRAVPLPYPRARDTLFAIKRKNTCVDAALAYTHINM